MMRLLPKLARKLLDDPGLRIPVEVSEGNRGEAKWVLGISH